MADFRKWFLAFAVLALLSSLSVPAYAQGSVPAFNCVTTGVPVISRSEGITELVGDIVLDCTGGQATAPGQPVPTANFEIFLGPSNVGITSKVTPAVGALANSPFNEATLLIDEPNNGRVGAFPILGCGEPTAPETIAPVGGVNSGVCTIVAGNGTGNDTYNGTQGHPNAWQGRYTNYINNQVPLGAAHITFLGVPIDPPGTSGHRIIRITNIRADMTGLVGSNSISLSSQVTAYVTITGTQGVPVGTFSQTVAFSQFGLLTVPPVIIPGSQVPTQTVQATSPFVFTAVSPFNIIQFLQCKSQNPDLLAGNVTVFPASQFRIQAFEGYASGWKTRNYSQTLANTIADRQTYNGAQSFPVTDVAQDVPGKAYFTEAGFQHAYTGNAALAPRGFNEAGVASQGTQLQFVFRNFPQGPSVSTGAVLFLPTTVNLINSSQTANVTGFARLVSLTGGQVSPIARTASITVGSVTTTYTFWGQTATSTSAATNPNSITAIYEIGYGDPGIVERIDIPGYIAFLPSFASSTQGTPTPSSAPGATVETNFWPQSTIHIPSTSAQAPHPRFSDVAGPSPIFTVSRCLCNILFPFVSNQNGFDTGVAISNTTLDPFRTFPNVGPGADPQDGTVTIWYYNGDPVNPAPAKQTSAIIKAGQTLTFSLSGDSPQGILKAPGFQGYLIAQAQFQYCHGFAFFSQSGNPFNGAEGYLGIILDQATLDRTGTIGENKGH